MKYRWNEGKTPQNVTEFFKLFSQFLLLVIGADVMLASTTEANSAVWPGHYTDDHQLLHLKVQDAPFVKIQDFQIVIPAATNQNYHHATYHVRHKPVSRVRRDLAGREPEDRSLFYALSGFGQDFRFHLESNQHLLAPTFTVKRIKRGTNEEELEDGHDSTGCHYHGHLVSHGGTPIAVSTCDGLTGMLRTEEDDFLIEPIPSHINHTFDAPIHPHIIYRKRDMDKGNHRLHYCGKKRYHPVRIPPTSEEHTLNLLSNGEIELEDVKEARKRKRRSVEFYGPSSVGLIESDLNGRMIGPRQRPRIKTVETLVVADRDMIRHHDRDQRDITTYVLTIMNMVTTLYSERSLDEQINVVLVGLVLLEDNQGLHLDHKADRSLANFCRWQYSHNRNRSKAADHSILITGIDICVHKNSPCETLGLAQIGGMCNTRHSCTINEDIGLGVAFTIAHETGHSFGMRHDGQGNMCSKRDGHIMSPTLNGLNGVFTWSACSRQALGDFLNDADSVCLDDHPAPTDNLRYPQQLPGEIYSSEAQCQWQFGSSARICDFRYRHKQSGMCKVLWCQREGSRLCETKYMPAAEGTSCGANLWCRRGVCVSYGDEGPDPINGGWSEYGSWSECTRTCGGGVQFQNRECNNPPPAHGGQHCQGKEKIYQLCNVQDCPSSQLNFREEQCAKFNQKPYRRQYFNWIPFTKFSHFGRGRCELLCKAEGYDFFDMLADRVEDGTPCDDTSPDVCIEGKCQHVGCDRVLGSNSTLDVCGVCNGDNSTCDKISGTYREEAPDSGYYEVVRIPHGARNVKIAEEDCCTHSYIAIKSATPPNTYQLNGNWQVDLYGTITIAGVLWNYQRKSYHPEELFTPGPLMEDIIVEVLIVGRNPGVFYSYTVPKATNNNLSTIKPLTTPSPASYTWNVEYTACSVTCAGGLQSSVVTCLLDNIQTVDNGKCPSASKPAPNTRQCNLQSCPPRWTSSEWTTCSVSCGTGSQVREVTCRAMTHEGDVNVTDSECDTSRKPELKQKCELTKCPPEWHTGQWSECSRDCGRGVRRRPVRCRSGHKRLRKSACDPATKPESRKRCFIARCKRKYQWFVTDWEQCSATCDSGVQRRKIRCNYKKRNGRYRTVGTRRCRHQRKPEVSLHKKCFATNTCVTTAPTPSPITPSPSPIVPTPSPIVAGRSSRRFPSVVYNSKDSKWVAGSWQKCTASCGGGVQIRLVKCLLGVRPMTSLACSHRSKPLSRRYCNTYKCTFSASNETPESCQDNYSWCYLVPQHGQCSHNYFGTKCCKTCTSSAR